MEVSYSQAHQILSVPNFKSYNHFAQAYYTRTQTHDMSYFALNFAPLLYSNESPSVERLALKKDTDNS